VISVTGICWTFGLVRSMGSPFDRFVALFGDLHGTQRGAQQESDHRDQGEGLPKRGSARRGFPTPRLSADKDRRCRRRNRAGHRANAVGKGKPGLLRAYAGSSEIFDFVPSLVELEARCLVGTAAHRFIESTHYVPAAAARPHKKPAHRAIPPRQQKPRNRSARRRRVRL